MSSFDKLRILWIDDREGDHPTYQYPEPELPKEYEPYFTIIRHPRGGKSTVRTPREFSDLFKPFWAGAARGVFPAEIIAMDYVLSKWSPGEVRARVDKKTEDAHRDRVDQASRSAKLRSDAPRGVDGRIVGFEGLLIGIFYASLTCDYPAGLVPMTNYGDLMEGVNEVRALHAISQSILDIDYSNFGVSGTDRSWRNVLYQGLNSLRYRITSLFISRRINLSLADIVAMKDKLGEAVLTIRSNYGTRCLPVAGLFADVENPEDRSAKISGWAKELLGEAEDQDPFEAITEARSIANEHWKKYLEEGDVIQGRWRLSELCASSKHGPGLSETEHTELKRYIAFFDARGPVQPPNKMWELWTIHNRSRVISICDDSRDGLITRWASVFVLARLIAHLLQCQRQLDRKSGTENSTSCFSHFCARDWLYALMPSPEVSLILPRHYKGRNNPASAGGTLNRKLRRLNSVYLPATGDDNIRNCGFDCQHVIDGKEKEDGDLGLRPVERRLLENTVMDHLAEAGQEGETLVEFRARLPGPIRQILQGAKT